MSRLKRSLFNVLHFIYAILHNLIEAVFVVMHMVDRVNHGTNCFHSGRTSVQREVLDAPPRGLAVARGVFGVHKVHVNELLVPFAAVYVVVPQGEMA